jgi:glutamate racemase
MENRQQTLQKEVEENVRLLDKAQAEAAQLTLRLQEEVEGRTKDREEYDLALQSMDQQSKKLKEQLHGVQRDLTDVQSRSNQPNARLEQQRTRRRSSTRYHNSRG